MILFIFNKSSRFRIPHSAVNVSHWLQRRFPVKDGALTRVAGHLLLGGMGLVGEALVLLSVLRGVLAVLCVLGRVLRVLLLGLAVGRVLRGVMPVLGVCGMLWMLAVLAVLVVRATVRGEVLCVGRAVAGVGLGGM